VPRPMYSGRWRRTGVSRLFRNPIWAIALVAIMLFSAFAIEGAPSAGGSTAGSAPVVAPAAGTPPTIYSFSAFPSEFLEGTSTSLSVSAFALTPITYTYTGLPPGCLSANTSYLSCTPTSPGYYNVTVTLVDTSTPAVARAFADLLVDAVATGTFFGLNSTVASFSNPAAEDCASIASPPFYQNFCSPETQAPTLLPLPNGTLGLGYQRETTVTTNACSSGNETVARVNFQVSTDNGSSFGAVRDIGNDTCAYLDAIEPSFAVGNGTVYGAFIEENSSLLPWQYVDRSGDALGFVTSTDNGTNFSVPLTLDPSGNFARPVVAAFGANVYIAVENIENSTTPIAGGVLPISIEVYVSTDGGSTWQAPVTLPGLNATADFNAMSPAIAVNATGTVTVAYATGRTCVSTGPLGCAVYGDEIVASSSTDNGSAWSAPTMVAPAAGESACFTGACESAYFESTPEIALAYAPDGVDLYVAYAATYDQGPTVPNNFNHTGLFAAASTNAGASWVDSTLDAANGPTALRYFEPAIGANASTVFVSTLVANESAGTWGFANSLSDFVQTLPVGGTTAWSVPTANDIESFVYGGSVNSTRSSFPGFSSSVAFLPSGRATIAFALPGASTYTVARGKGYYYANTSYPGALVVGSLVRPGDSDALTVSFTQTGIPTGQSWLFTINGVPYRLSTPMIEFTNVPLGVPLMVGAYYEGGYWTITGTYFNASLTSFYFNTTDTFPFEVWVGLEFNMFPSGTGIWWNVDPYGTEYIEATMVGSPFYAYVYADWELDGNYICIFTCTYTLENYNSYYSSATSWYTSCLNSICAWPGPWYFPLGSTVYLNTTQWAIYALTPTYWTGQGAGSYTGLTGGSCYDPFFDCDFDSGAIQMLGPINETLWLANGPVNLTRNLTISAYGLPASSVYHFTMNGVTYNGTAPADVTIANVPSGAYQVSSVWATSSKPGWEYFGFVNDPNPFLSAALTAVNLSFDAFVNVSAPVGVVSFHAPGLAPGTYWAVTLNDTHYGSTTPWINVTTQPGTYTWAVADAVAPNGTAGYVPTGVPSSLPVVTGKTYEVSYVPAYLVHLESSTGGLVSLNGGFPTNSPSAWEAAGAPVSISASLSAGYAFVGWSGTGTGAYSGNATSTQITVGGPILESATFQPLPGARFNLTLSASGLPAGTWWTANLNGAGHSSNSATLTIGNLWPWSAPNSLGQYNLTIPNAFENNTNLTRFVALPTFPTTVGTNGSFTPTVPVTFQEQSLLQLYALPGGTPEATYDGAPAGSSTWVVPGGEVTMVAVHNPGYVFSGWEGTGNGSYTGPESPVTITSEGPITEVAVFTPQVTPPLPRYSITFHLSSSIEPSTIWGIVFGGQGYSSNGPNLTIPNVLGGTYGVSVVTAVSPSGLVEYQATANDPAAYTVRGNATLDITYQTYYWVSVSASVGGSVSPGSGFYEAGQLLYLVATPNSTYSFDSWAGTGGSSYSGSNATASILVQGSLTEIATFRATPTGASTSSSIWSNPLSWLGIGALALVVGLIVGTVGARWRARSAGPPVRSPPTAPTSPPGARSGP
jgi:uncharacterized repeat protein (TIGR02543 family)